MKIRALVSLCVTLVVAVAATTISFSGTRNSGINGDEPAMCEHGGFQLTALLHSASAQEPTASEWCGVNAAESLSESTFEQVPVINLHQSVDQMYISGKGFGSSEALSVDVQLLSGGAMGAAYSLPINSIEAGAFTSHPTGVFCEAPNDRLFVLVMDGEGNEHARIFEPGEFRCPAA